MAISLKELIFRGYYDDAEKILLKMNANEQREIILNLAYDTESISIYSFLKYILEKNKESFWLDLIIDVMIHPLCFIEGAYSVALFHVRELLKINENIDNMEMLLFFHHIPEKLISDSEAKEIAKKIIAIEPYNVKALDILK